MASGSIKCSSPVIQLDTTYTITYNSTSTPYTIFASMYVDIGSFRIWGYDGITATSGSKSFKLSTADYESLMTENGYSASSYTPSKIQFELMSDDLEVFESYSCTCEFESISDCSAPSSISLGNDIAESFVTLSWSGASSGDANSITGYEVQYSDSPNGSTWSTWSLYETVTTTNRSASLSVVPPSTRGYYRRFRVRTMGSAGENYYSSYKTCSTYLRKNQLPITPSVIPANGKTTYNKTPRILIMTGIDPDGQQVTPVIMNCSGSETSSGFSSSELGSDEASVYAHSEQIAAGGYTVHVHAKDSFNAASSAKSVALTVAELTFDEIVANETHVKAQHITELQAAVNTVRDYYGLDAYSFTTIVAGETKLAEWTDHIAELRAAIDEIISFVNSYDSTNTVNNINPVAWLEIPVNKPRKDVIDQIRNTIPLL